MFTVNGTTETVPTQFKEETVWLSVLPVHCLASRLTDWSGWSELNWPKPLMVVHQCQCQSQSQSEIFNSLWSSARKEREQSFRAPGEKWWPIARLMDGLGLAGWLRPRRTCRTILKLKDLGLKKKKGVKNDFFGRPRASQFILSFSCTLKRKSWMSVCGLQEKGGRKWPPQSL